MSEIGTHKSFFRRYLVLTAAALLAVAFLYKALDGQNSPVVETSVISDTQLETRHQTGNSVQPQGPGRLDSSIKQTGTENTRSLPAGLRISGWVMTQGGEPLTGIVINATPVRLFSAGIVAKREALQMTVSGSSGFFLFESLPDGEYLLQTVPTDLYPAVQRLVRAGNEQADLVVAGAENTVFVFGKVSDERGVPVERVQVTVPGKSSGFAFSGKDGYYSLEFIPEPGKTHKLQFRHSAYHLHELTLKPVDFAETDLLSFDVVLAALERISRVSGYLRGSEGKAVPGEEVTLYSGGFRRHHASRSDTNGYFSIENVAVGNDYRLQVLPGASFRDHVQGGLEVPADGLELNIVLEPVATGSLAGQMVNTEGEPIPNFTLQLNSHEARIQHLAVSGDSGGEFYVENVPSGRISFFSHSEPRLRVGGLLLGEGEIRDVTLVRDWGPYSLQGRVLDAAGKPVPASPITLTWSLQQGELRNHSIRTAVADQDGYFLFTQLGSGWHKLHVTASGYEHFQLEVPVSGSSQAVQVLLEEKLP